MTPTEMRALEPGEYQAFVRLMQREARAIERASRRR
jgi:hypothetical protein